MSQAGPPADAKQAQAAALQELEAAQKKKRAMDTSLVSLPTYKLVPGAQLSEVMPPQANLEASIYAFEGSYLEETAATGGNIIKVSFLCVIQLLPLPIVADVRRQGFDNYLKPPTATNTKKKQEPIEADRLFSTSSGTYAQVRRCDKYTSGGPADHV